MSVQLLRVAYTLTLVGEAWLAGAQLIPAPVPPVVHVPYEEARAIMAALPDHIPSSLGTTWPERQATWPAWVAKRDGEIRARVQGGDEDSLVNLWLYGTSFTTLPRAIDRDVQRWGGALTTAQVAGRRLDDFLAALASPDADERLVFARAVIGQAGLDATTREGRSILRRYLTERRRRAQSEFERYAREVSSAVRADADAEVSVLATLFRNRGLSSDTSLLPDFAVDQALEAASTRGIIRARSVHRAALIGPGLDTIGKADGHDFYPEQTTQPFALIDSLVRLGLAPASGLRLTAFDLNERVVRHLAAAGGTGYTMQLRLDDGQRWSASVVRFWNELGARIADPAAAVTPPGNAGTPLIRAVRVRSEVIRAVEAHDLNIVTERQSLPAGQRFSVIVATNVLVYYDAFEQALAMANLAAMLEPGGVLLTNNLVQHAPGFSWPLHMELTYSERQRDHMFLYRRTEPAPAASTSMPAQ